LTWQKAAGPLCSTILSFKCSMLMHAVQLQTLWMVSSDILSEKTWNSDIGLEEVICEEPSHGSPFNTEPGIVGALCRHNGLYPI